MQEIISSLTGAWRLLMHNASGHEMFTHTVGGFWRSFGVIAPFAVLYFFALSVEAQMMSGAQSGTSSPAVINYPVMTLALIIEWFSFPLLMAFLAKPLGVGARYASYIIAYNWSSFIIMALFTVPFALYSVGVLAAAPAMFINLGVTVYVLYYRFYVAQTALMTSVAVTSGLVAVDLLLSILISIGAERLTG